MSVCNMENIDCIVRILSNLPIRERECCRLISEKWSWSADLLARTQHTLNISGDQERIEIRQSDNFHFQPETINTIRWPHKFIRYQCYCLLLKRFPNLCSIRFESIHHWNDHLIEELAKNCPHLTTIAFVRCHGLGRSRMNEVNFINLTLNGWNQLIESYGQQVTCLILQDCDIDDRHLAIIINGFRQLKYLDIRNNRIMDNGALKNLPNTIETLKLGPKLHPHFSLDSSQLKYIPIEPIVSGAGRMVTELCLQGFIDERFCLVSTMSNLRKLTLHFIKPSLETSTLKCFSAIQYLKKLQCLEIQQHNAHDCSAALMKEHLNDIFIGCRHLEKFIFHCDICCDTPMDDQTIAQMRKSCPKLKHLDLCPGNFQTTDWCLNVLSTFQSLRYLKIVDFIGISGAGVLNLLEQSGSLTDLIVEDCCDVDPKTLLRTAIKLHEENPHRYLNVRIVPLHSLQTSSHAWKIPEVNPKISITIVGHDDRDRFGLKNLTRAKHSSQWTRLRTCFKTVWSFLMNIPTSLLNFAKLSFTMTLLISIFLVYLFEACLNTLNTRINQFLAGHQSPSAIIQTLIWSLIFLLIALYLFSQIHPTTEELNKF